MDFENITKILCNIYLREMETYKLQGIFYLVCTRYISTIESKNFLILDLRQGFAQFQTDFWSFV